MPWCGVDGDGVPYDLVEGEPLGLHSHAHTCTHTHMHIHMNTANTGQSCVLNASTRKISRNMSPPTQTHVRHAQAHILDTYTYTHTKRMLCP